MSSSKTSNSKQRRNTQKGSQNTKFGGKLEGNASKVVSNPQNQKKRHSQPARGTQQQTGTEYGKKSPI